MASGAGEIVRIWVKRSHRGVMDARDRARVIADHGLEGGVSGGKSRTVTLLEEERWAAATAHVGAEVDPAARRANVLVRGISLAKSRGRRLRIGSCLLEIRGETRPCERMDEAQPGLCAALDPDWRAGAYGRVLEEGDIAVGDEVRFEDTGASEG